MTDLHLVTHYNSDGGKYLIMRKGEKISSILGDEVWSRPIQPEDPALCGEYFYPPDVRAEYERRLGRPEFLDMSLVEDTDANLVELFSDDQGFDQPCAFGNRCNSHAVYCHNEAWLYAPRKCRRTWYTGGETRDEDCPGFKPNPRHEVHKPEEKQA